jgi:hypothetical protein
VQVTLLLQYVSGNSAQKIFCVEGMQAGHEDVVIIKFIKGEKSSSEPCQVRWRRARKKEREIFCFKGLL